MAVQSCRATFTGVEPYVDVPLAMTTPYVVMQGITQNGAVSSVDYAITLTGGTNARVEPSNLFVGYVDFVVADL